MGHEVCKIDVGDQGVTSQCNQQASDGNEIRVMTINARPLKISAIPDVSEKSHRLKEKYVKAMIRNVSDCYRGKIKGASCSDPIDLVIFKYEKCPACEIHLPVLKRRILRLARNDIPIKYNIFDVKDADAVELYKQAHCSGTPCVVLRDPRSKKFIHVAEGIDQDLAFHASLFGIDNPLYIPISKKTVPRNLLDRIK